MIDEAGRWPERGLQASLATGRLLDIFPPLLLIPLVLPAVVVNRDSAVSAVILTVLTVLPLLVRRKYPVAVFAFLCAVALVQWVLDVRLIADVALLVAFYTLTSRSSRRIAVAGTVTLEIGAALAVARWDHSQSWFITFIMLSGLICAAGVLGIYSQTRLAYLASLHERADRAEAERDQRVQLAAAAERSRIARELHDIVAHHLTVMIALSEGAATLAGLAPDRAAEAMTTVSATGRQALADTRRLLGVLREPNTADRRPQPDLSSLDGLLEQVRAAGLATTLIVRGARLQLPSAMELTVYRLIQEALTNSLKYAGPSASAWVELSYTEAGLVVQITDDGLGSTAPQQSSVGHGLPGMAERVAAWGGVLQAGPGRPGGWRVTARLSVPQPTGGPAPTPAVGRASVQA